MRFEFATAGRIVFGDGLFAGLPGLASGIGGTRALWVRGAVERHAEGREALERAGIATTAFSVSAEPTIEVAREGTRRARDARCDLVIAVGGGSVLDAGKAIAMLLGNGTDPLDHLEVVGRGLPITGPSVPMIAVPTTAGTGSEVTRNAVLADAGRGVKASLRSETMLPRIALVDPELTWSMPPSLTASTGLDALTQVIEPFLSRAASPFTDALCREAIPRAATALVRAFERGDDRQARSEMALVGVSGGMALANAKLGAVHGLAAPIGGAFDAPHGAVCARLLPRVLQSNLRALRARGSDGDEARTEDALARHRALAVLLTGKADAQAEDSVAWVEALVRRLGIPGLSTYGIAEAHLPDLAEAGLRASSMKGNPVTLTRTELTELMTAAL